MDDGRFKIADERTCIALKKPFVFSLAEHMHPLNIITFIWLMSIQPWILFIYFDFAQFFFRSFFSVHFERGFWTVEHTLFLFYFFSLWFSIFSLPLWLVFYSNINLFASQPCIIHKWTWAQCLRSSDSGDESILHWWFK